MSFDKRSNYFIWRTIFVKTSQITFTKKDVRIWTLDSNILIFSHLSAIQAWGNLSPRFNLNQLRNIKYTRDSRIWIFDIEGVEAILVLRQPARQHPGVPWRRWQRDRFLWEEEEDQVRPVRCHGEEIQSFCHQTCLLLIQRSFLTLSLLQGFPSHTLSLSNKVTLPEGRGGAVATLRHNYRGRNSSVGIFLHAGCQLGHVLQSSSSSASISPSSL